MQPHKLIHKIFLDLLVEEISKFFDLIRAEFIEEACKYGLFVRGKIFDLGKFEVLALLFDFCECNEDKLEAAGLVKVYSKEILVNSQQKSIVKLPFYTSDILKINPQHRIIQF